MTRGAGGRSPAKVQKYLEGVQYPTDKDDLVSKARSHGAPHEVMEVLEGLPRDRFNGPQDVMKAYGEEQGED